jgi:hypothetical protein
MAQEKQTVHRLSVALFKTILEVLEGELGYRANVSYRICEEIIIHYRRDMNRLRAVHHKLIHPTKHCSYLAFWIRKLKPVSNAFPTSIAPPGEELAFLDPAQEVTDINEKLALFCAMRYLHDYIKNGIVPRNASNYDVYVQKYILAVETFFNSIDDTEDAMGNRFQSLVYDLRFRTFGPHHLTHVLTHILREVTRL